MSVSPTMDQSLNSNIHAINEIEIIILNKYNTNNHNKNYCLYISLSFWQTTITLDEFGLQIYTSISSQVFKFGGSGRGS